MKPLQRRFETIRMNRQCSHSLWLRLGPGAIIASLTIGSGELIFHSCWCSLWAKVVWFFCLVCLLKWVLLYTTGRQMILRGIHPMESWTRLPGPRGWLPVKLLLLGIPCFPIWVAFHATTASLLPGGFVMGWHAGMLWPYLLLLLCAVLSIAGQYKWLEKIQLLLVSLLLGIAMVALSWYPLSLWTGGGWPFLGEIGFILNGSKATRALLSDLFGSNCRPMWELSVGPVTTICAMSHFCVKKVGEELALMRGKSTLEVLSQERKFLPRFLQAIWPTQ